MAAGNAIRAGRAYVELFADDSKLIRGLKSAQQRLQGFGRIVGTIGAAMHGAADLVIAPLTAAAYAFAAAGDVLDKASARTGISAAALSELGYAAQQSGSDLGAVETGLRGMAKFTHAAAGGSKEAAETLGELGVSMKSLKGLAPDEQFTVLADALSRIEDPTQRAALAMKVFGKSGTALLPLFSDGAKGIEALRQRARDLGLTWTNEDATAAAALGDAFDDVQSQMKRVVQIVGAAVAPLFLELATAATTVGKAIIDFVDGNREMVRTILLVAAGVAVAGAVITGLGIAFWAAGAAIGGVATVLGAISTVLGAVLSPIGLLVVALAGLAVWLYKSGVLTDWLKTTFGPLLDEALAAFDGIRSALAGGDFGAAAQVLWTTLKFWWTKGVSWLTEIWIEFKRSFLEIFLGLSNQAAKILTDVWAGFQTSIQQGMKSLDAAQGGVANSLLRAAGEEGIMGDAARLIVGSDLRGGLADEAIAESDRMTAQDQAGRDAASAQIEADRQATQAELDAQFERDIAGMHGGLNQQLQDSQAELDKSRADFEKAIGDAQAAGEGAGATGAGAVPDWLAGLLDQLDAGAGAAMTKAHDSPGTFSSEAGRMIAQGGDDPMKAIEEHTKETARNTKRIAQQGAVVFGP